MSAGLSDTRKSRLNQSITVLKGGAGCEHCGPLSAPTLPLIQARKPQAFTRHALSTPSTSLGPEGCLLQYRKGIGKASLGGSEESPGDPNVRLRASGHESAHVQLPEHLRAQIVCSCSLIVDFSDAYACCS